MIDALNIIENNKITIDNVVYNINEPTWAQCEHLLKLLAETNEVPDGATEQEKNIQFLTLLFKRGLTFQTLAILLVPEVVTMKEHIEFLNNPEAVTTRIKAMQYNLTPNQVIVVLKRFFDFGAIIVMHQALLLSLNLLTPSVAPQP